VDVLFVVRRSNSVAGFPMTGRAAALTVGEVGTGFLTTGAVVLVFTVDTGALLTVERGAADGWTLCVTTVVITLELELDAAGTGTDELTAEVIGCGPATSASLAGLLMFFRTEIFPLGAGP